MFEKRLTMKHTNKDKLFKGIKFLAGALPLFFLGPTIMYSAFSNQDKPLYWPVLIFSFLVCAGAMFLMFRGIKTIMSSMFDD